MPHNEPITNPRWLYKVPPLAGDTTDIEIGLRPIFPAVVSNSPSIGAIRSLTWWITILEGGNVQRISADDYPQGCCANDLAALTVIQGVRIADCGDKTTTPAMLEFYQRHIDRLVSAARHGLGKPRTVLWSAVL